MIKLEDNGFKNIAIDQTDAMNQWNDSSAKFKQ